MITFEDLLNPLSLDEFYDIYYKKRWCVIKGNDFRKDLFSKIITWQKFSRYINNDRAVSGLQAILPDGRKLCMEKWNLFKSKKPDWCKKHYFEKKYLHDIWTNHGTIILTKASLLTPEISHIAAAVENELGGAADAHFYCSYSEKSHSFKAHADLDDNFLIHAHGTVSWTVCDNIDHKKGVLSTFNKEVGGIIAGDKTEFDLTVGDILYIPKGMVHKAVPKSKRISISVPVTKRIGAKKLDRHVYDFS